MRLLLDTHIFIWACVEPERLSEAQRTAIVNPLNEVYVSAVNAWEIAIKQALGRLAFPAERFDEFAAASGFRTLVINTAHAVAAGRLPRHHDDPFDRMLVAQAASEGLTLVSDDRKLPAYGVPVFT